MSQRVSITQGDRAILEATIWSVDDTEGLEHNEYAPPDVAGPEDLRSRDELSVSRTFAFWDNVEMKPVRFGEEWPPRGPLPPVWQAWCRFRPIATFEDDPWLDACRSVILVDVQSWPANSQHHAWKEPHGFIAPSLDLYVAFHGPAPEEQWLLADGYAPVSREACSGGRAASGPRAEHWLRRPQGRLCTGGFRCQNRRTHKERCMAEINGTWDTRFDVVAETLQKSLEAGTDVGASVTVMLRRRARRRHLGRLPRLREVRTLGERHDRERLVDDQDDDVSLRLDARRSR